MRCTPSRRAARGTGHALPGRRPNEGAVWSAARHTPGGVQPHPRPASPPLCPPGRATCRRPPVGNLEYLVTVRVAPAAKPRLALLDERAPKLPLPSPVERDERGWARPALRAHPTETAKACCPSAPRPRSSTHPNSWPNCHGLAALEDPLPLLLRGSSEAPLGHKVEIAQGGRISPGSVDGHWRRKEAPSECPVFFERPLSVRHGRISSWTELPSSG